MTAHSRSIAAIDLGSNSFHMVVARLRPDARDFVVIDRLKRPVRLRMGLDDTGRITPSAQRRALDCLALFGERLSGLSRGDVRAVGTNTLRNARNGLPFLVRARQALGHKIEVISGREEARLIYRGVARDLAEPGRRLVVDIGGGSTELIVGAGAEPEALTSLEAGCVSWTLRHFADGHITARGFEKAVVEAQLVLRSGARALSSTHWDTTIGASGTIKAIDRVLAAMWGLPAITRGGLDKLVAEVVAARHIDQLSLPGLREVRRPVFVGGLAVLVAVFRALHLESMTAAQGALREGVLLDLLGRLHQDDVRDDTVSRLIVRYGIDTTQSAAVRERALGFFDAVAPVWGLTHHRHRRLLGWAADLHEAGIFVNHSGFHRHGAYLLRHADLPGFSRQDQAALAALVRVHRGGISASRVEALYDGRSRPILRLAALLRLAVLVHRTRQDDLPDGVVTVDGDTISLGIDPDELAARPLLRADLQREAERLREADLRLRIR